MKCVIVPIPIEAIKALTQAQLLVYATIVALQAVEFSSDDIEKLSGLSKATITKALNELAEMNWITNDNGIYSANIGSTMSIIVAPETQQDTPARSDYADIFSYWNGKQIIVHKKLDDKTKRAIKSALNEHSKEDIYKAIDNYATVLRSDEYFFSYKWTLVDFLNRGLRKFIDISDPLNNFRKDKSKAKLPTIDKLYGKYNI